MSRTVSLSLNLLHPKHSRRCGSLLLPFCPLGRLARPSPLLSQSSTSFVPLNFVRWNSNEGQAQGEIKEVELKAEPVEAPKEKIVGAHTSHEFQAQTRKILDIVARSLYTDREVFLRELVSNASDALEKLRHLQLSGNQIIDESLPLQITLSVNEKANTLTIQDTGIGMTEEELIKNLGTIARSGSEEFSKNLEKPQESNIIGQFGVGFYSAFMIADRIEVFSRSASSDSKGYYWTSTGEGDFETSEAEGVSRGTKIILHLKDHAKEFTQIPRLENIIRKYSNFVGFDILIGGEKVNTVKALWMSSPSKVTEEDYNDFYQFVGHAYDQHLYRLHFNTDSPLPMNSLLFVPSKHQEKYGLSKQPSGVSLYSKKVLIQQRANVLPDWLRFVKGVIDCPELPLSLSRENTKDILLVKRLGMLVTRKLVKLLEDEQKSDPEKYHKFFEEHGQFINEGIATDPQWRDKLANLYLAESSNLDAGKKTNLEGYISRMQPEQKEIYYLSNPNRNFALASPYFEMFKKKGMEVLFIYQPIEEFVLGAINEFQGKKLVSIETSIVEDKTETSTNSELVNWLKEVLKDRVSSVKVTERLVSSPAFITDHESASLRKMMKFVEKEKTSDIPKQDLKINPTHPLIVKLDAARTTNPSLAEEIAHQLMDNTMMSAGLLDDSRHLIPRINQIMKIAAEKALSRNDTPTAPPTDANPTH